VTIANRQIDHGSTIIFAAAGTCGFGALSAAAHILASTVKRYDRAVLMAPFCERRKSRQAVERAR
jgi:hypothetical protein